MRPPPARKWPGSGPRRRRPASRRALAQSPTKAGPCMRASVRGARSARRRSVGAVDGREAGGAEHVLGGEGRADHVDVVHERRAVAELAQQVAAEQGAGGLVEEHLGLPAVGHVRGGDGEDRVPADVEGLVGRSRPRGGRSAQVVERHVAAEGVEGDLAAAGAASSQRFIAPHSSDSTWPKEIHRRRSRSSTLAAAGATRSNIWRGPVWKSSGSSASIRYWLKVKPPGATSGTHVDRR